MRPFAYSNPATLEAALGAIGPQARPLAGGTDLLALIKADLAAPERLVNVKASSSAERSARIPAGLCAASTSTVGDRRTISSRPGEVTSAT